jgi:hypothetical protein
MLGNSRLGAGGWLRSCVMLSTVVLKLSGGVGDVATFKRPPDNPDTYSPNRQISEISGKIHVNRIIQSVIPIPFPLF